MEIYVTVDDFFKENNFDRGNEHEKGYRRIVKGLNFDICKGILLKRLELDGVTIETLKEKYKQDKYLNNIYKHNATGVWEWDLIGDDMLHNPNAKIRFKLMWNFNRTCIAKACARMVAEDY